MIAEYPGEVLMLDYIKIGLSRSGYTYVLMLVDKFSRLVEFVPAAAATSVVAARAVLRWAAQRGLPCWMISDGGPHFDNELMEALAQVLGYDHHITMPCCPWANGSVEVVGKDLCWTLRALCSEFQASVDEWDLVLPLAEYAINHRRRAILGDRSAVEIMTGRQPRTPVDLAVWSGPNLKEAKEMRLPAQRADAYMDRLAESLALMHERVRDKDQHDRRVRAMREARRGHAMHFRRGEYVMVAAEGNQANVQRHSKVMVKYQGPYECMGLDSDDPDKVLVRLVGQDDVAKVSWRRVFRIAGPEMTVTQAVQDSALHDLQRFKVESFVDWGFANDGTVVFKVHWRGFAEDEDTWEPMAQLDDDVEVLVGKFVEETDNPDLTQALLQVRARRRSRTATARRQTDRLAGRTYANAAARATTPAVGPNVTAQPAVTATTNPINDTRAARADRRSRRARARQALASDAASAVNDTAAASDAARDDRARRRASRRR